MRSFSAGHFLIIRNAFASPRTLCRRRRSSKRIAWQASLNDVGEIDAEQNDARQQRAAQEKRPQIAQGKGQFFIFRPHLAARIAPRVHRVAEFVRPAESADEKRNQHGDHRLDPPDESARFEIRAARLLRVHDPPRFVRQDGNEAESDAHDEREFVHGETDEFQGEQQTFDAVR